MSQAYRPSVIRQLLPSIIAVVAFSMAFFSGYLFGRADGGSPSWPLVSLLDGAGNGGRAPVARVAGESLLSDEEQQRFQIFWEAWSIVEREFYDRPAIDRQKLIYGATKGMVEAVGDPYTVYLTPTNRELSDTDLRGSFDGIGIQVDLRDNRLTVIAPIEGSPAEQAGFKPGDVVTQVDGKSIAGKSLNDTVLLIRGPRGTSVTLTVVRPNTPEPLTFTVTRAEIKVDSVRSRMLDQGVGYLRISTFGANTPAETVTALKQLLDAQPAGIVIDLRSNPGGYLHASIEIASQFMSDGVVLYQANGNGDRKTYRAEAGGIGTQTRLAILVNKGTASASEILAAALRDNGRAVIIGEKTFGKGTVQNVHQLSDQSGLRVTTAQWLTPNEQPIQGQGLTPDQVVTNSAEGPDAPDLQLQAAIRYLLGG